MRRGALTEAPPTLPSVELLEGVEAPVVGVEGPCPERFGGGCWPGRPLAALLVALHELTSYAADAWSQCRDRGR